MITPENDKSRFKKFIMKGLLPVLIILAGVGVWWFFRATSPRIERTPPERGAAMVDVLTVRAQDVQLEINAMGIVIPSREVILKARGSGEVVGMSPNFLPGGRVAKDEEILKLEPFDYQVAIEKAKSVLEQARADLAIEEGSQIIAREELRLLSEAALDEVQETDLALRKPQLKKAYAAVSAAEADLRTAVLNLERSVVRVPFNAMFVERNVNLGSRVNSQGVLATIVDTDEYWVEALVPLDRLTALDTGQKDCCPVTLVSQVDDGQWKGKVLQVAGKLSEDSHMANVIVAVSDPLGLKSKSNSRPLLLNDYVSVKIQGRELSSVIDIPRLALRTNNTVWVFDDSTLNIKNVELAWKQGDRLLISSGLESGEKLIVSDLSAPVQGMDLRIAGEQTNHEEQATPSKRAENK